MSRSRNPPPRGQGAARAKQMGLLLDLDGGVDDGGNEEELEAELQALMGGGGGGSSGKKGGGKAPVPMADIERMAALCMKDLDEEEDGGEDLDDDEDLLAELNEVLEDEHESSCPARPQPSQPSPPRSSPGGGPSLEGLLVERISMYQTAITNARAAGEDSKARRFDRGLKTLQSLLASAKKGKTINEEEIPPPVAVGEKPAAAPAPSPQPEPIKQRDPPAPALTPSPQANQKPLREAAPPPSRFLTPLQKTPDTPAISPLTPCQPNAQHSEGKQRVLSRQREYKLAALQAKQGGDSDLAKQLYHVAKKLDSVVEALDRAEPVDLSSLPPPPDAVVERVAPPPTQSSSRPAAPAAPAAPVAAPPMAAPHVAETVLPAPSSVAEALQQRMDRYKAAAEAAKIKGDERKARMHLRIVKQYQDALRAHKVGRPVNLAELPVPPGCPPLQGSESNQQNFLGVLENAVKLANQDADADGDDDEGGPGEVAKPPNTQKPKAPPPPGGSPAPTQGSKLGPKAQQQLDFLLLRRQAFVRAALRSKQMKDMAGAAQHLRHAKGLDQMITAAKGGLPVDITKVPSAPVSEEEYSLGRSSRSSPLSPRSAQQYSQLMEQLKKQHEKCLGYCQQFTQMGNIAETSKFERLAEECVSSIEVLKKAHAKGRPVPKYHTEERTFNTVKLFPELTANDMMLYIVRGVNLPAPSGISPGDLDACVKFEFPFPSVEEAQRDRTSSVKGSSPEFRQQFKLNISRGHRAFRRLVQTKGIKLEVLHKGGLFKTDKVVGNAQLKLEALENQCEIREIIEVLDGRKATGGGLEVKVKIREPLGGAQLQSSTEKWLVLDPASPPHREKEQAPPPRSQPRPASGQPSPAPPQYKLHSFSLLHYDKERLERKIGEYRKNRREPPPDWLQQHREVTHRLQWQKNYLDRASPTLLAEYQNVLQRFIQGLAESVKKFSSQGNRDAAKDALGRLKMVESELESLKRRHTA